MALKLATPGVYIQEKNAFPNSVAPISTAVPAFIGYTEKTTRDGQSLVNKPVRLSSLPEFHDTFGGGFRTTYSLKDGKDILLGDKAYDIAPDGESRFMLYESMRHFFSNGGGPCYVISVGSYYQEVEEKKTTPAKDAKGKATTATQVTKKVNKIAKSALEGGIPPLVGEPEPTLLVIPEAVMLEKADCFALQQAMLMHCGFKMRNRFAILDVYDGYQKRSYDDKDVITQFREGVGNNYLNYGAAYYPWVYTSIVQRST